MDIGDVTVKLRADMGDVLSQMEDFARKMEDAGKSAEGLQASATDLGKDLDGLSSSGTGVSNAWTILNDTSLSIQERLDLRPPMPFNLPRI